MPLLCYSVSEPPQNCSVRAFRKEAQPTKKVQVNLTICSCATVRNTKSKISTWRPSWILGGTGLLKDPSSGPKLTKIFQMNRSRCSRVIRRKPKRIIRTLMSTWRPSWLLGGAGFRKEPSSSGPPHTKQYFR
jgi:hypothetical protein